MDTAVNIEKEVKRIKGSVTKIYYDKGYCFIAGEDNRDYFAHYSHVLRSSIAFRHLREGHKVSFTPQENDDPRQGPKAMQVELSRD